MTTITRDQKRRNIQTVANLVTDIVPYFDTLHLRTKFYFETKHFQKLNELSGGDVKTIRNPAFAKFTEFMGGYILPRPSDEAYEFLIETFNEDDIGLSRLDPAIDFLTATSQDGSTVHHYFDKYQVKLHPGKQRVSLYCDYKFKNTSYSFQRLS